jgi:hypothetical protein
MLIGGVVADRCQAKIISAVERLDGGAAPRLRDGAVAPTFAGLTPIWSDYAFFALDAPAYLRGSDLLMTRYNFDKIDPDYQLRVTLARPATVFVMVDDRVPDVPTTMPWLAALGFVDTGDNLDVRVSFDQRLTFTSIYRADFSAGPVVLLEQHDSNVNSGMYFVAAVPEPGTLVLVFVAVCACGLPFAAANGGRARFCSEFRRLL